MRQGWPFFLCPCLSSKFHSCQALWPLALSLCPSDLPLVCRFPPDLFSALLYIFMCNWIFGTVYRKLPLVFPAPWASPSESISLPVLSCSAFSYLWWSSALQPELLLALPHQPLLCLPLHDSAAQIATPPPCHTLLQTHLRSLSELASCPALASRFPVQSPLASLPPWPTGCHTHLCLTCLFRSESVVRYRPTFLDASHWLCDSASISQLNPLEARNSTWWERVVYPRFTCACSQGFL